MAGLWKLCKSFFYLGDTVVVKGVALNSAITRIRSGLCKFRDLVSLLDSRDLPLGAWADYILHVYVALCYMEMKI